MKKYVACAFCKHVEDEDLWYTCKKSIIEGKLPRGLMKECVGYDRVPWYRFIFRISGDYDRREIK